jgi:hypothetical protein
VRLTKPRLLKARTPHCRESISPEQAQVTVPSKRRYAILLAVEVERLGLMTRPINLQHHGAVHKKAVAFHDCPAILLRGNG